MNVYEVMIIHSNNIRDIPDDLAFVEQVMVPSKGNLGTFSQTLFICLIFIYLSKYLYL